MIYYERLKDGTIGKYTNNDKIAMQNGLNEQTQEELISCDGKCYLQSEYEALIQSLEYKTQKAQEEAERIAKLHLTRGDVFRALLKAKRGTRTQLRTAIEANKTLSDEERELALIDFDEALEFYRGVDLINILGASLGITSEQLDEFFETNDYTKLMPTAENNDVSEPVENVNTY